MDLSGGRLAIEVAYARPGVQRVVRLEVSPGTTLRGAVEQSGVLEEFPEIDLARSALGVFGTVRGPEEPVRAGDRVEIYRPLAADPKQRRRERAAAARRR